MYEDGCLLHSKTWGCSGLSSTAAALQRVVVEGCTALAHVHSSAYSDSGGGRGAWVQHAATPLPPGGTPQKDGDLVAHLLLRDGHEKAAFVLDSMGAFHPEVLASAHRGCLVEPQPRVGRREHRGVKDEKEETSLQPAQRCGEAPPGACSA
jgi:hypothetical protein